MAEADKKPVIVVAIDGSAQSEHAFEFYLEHLHQSGNHLLLINSAEPPNVSSQQAMYMSGELWEQMLESEKTKVKALEEKYADKMKAAKVSGTIKAVFHGNPGQVICDIAQEHHAGLIVMGTRGLGTVRRTIMGSCSDYVVHHAHCPVCVCRQ